MPAILGAMVGSSLPVNMNDFLKKLRMSALAVAVAPLCGCMTASEYQSAGVTSVRDGHFVSHYQMSARSRMVLQDSAHLLVVRSPADPWLMSKVKDGEKANRLLAQQVYARFRQWFAETRYQDDKPLSFEEALNLARQRQDDYLIYPELERWDDRGAPVVQRVLPGAGGIDHVSVVLRLVEADTGKTVNVWEIQGESGILTFFMDSPADLLGKPLADLAQRLSGHSALKDSSWQWF